MIYDCFLFYNELDILDIRLNELDSVVDKFVLVEATVTHTNKPKPLYYQENKKYFKKFHNKIIHIVVDDNPNVAMTWILERFQLTAVTRGLKNCKPDDTILFSCVDEIPKAKSILKWKDKPGRLKSFKQTLSMYFLNYVCMNYETERQTRMFKYKDIKYFKDIYLTLFLPPDVIIPDGGWHLSYMGGIKMIQQKLASFAHQELNNDKYNTPEGITRAISEGRDIFDFGWKFQITPIHFLPQYIQKNRSKFEKIIIKNKMSENILYWPILVPFLELMKVFRVNVLRKIKRNKEFNKLLMNDK